MNLLTLMAVCAAPPDFTDVTDAVGLGPEVIGDGVARLCFADLNADRWPDVVIDRHRVFLSRADDASPIGRSFEEIPAAETNLRQPVNGTLTVFADIDNDGHLDAVVTENVKPLDENWEDHGRRTSIQLGNGDGTFGDPQPIKVVRPATTCAVAIGDVDRDGWLDLFIGNWYAQYGASYAGYHNDLLLRVPGDDAAEVRRSWLVQHLPRTSEPELEPVGEHESFDEERDAGGRPTYGAMIADLDGGGRPELLELNYGRRWNRCWLWFERAEESGLTPWLDVAPPWGLDGDDVRHGRHPDWLKNRAKEDPRFDRPDEKPFRANGNTFDCAVNDVDNDGDFDVMLSTIAHAWAGESSDRTRILLQQNTEQGKVEFEQIDQLNVDRIPEDVQSWNQGDLFCALADLNHDARVDAIISSGDYPDNQRLRIYLQQPDGSLQDATVALGIDHDGSQQISLADVDGDGDFDLLVGQTFFRYSAEQKQGRTPQARLFVNQSTGNRKSITIRLHGDGERVNRDALGAVVRASLPDGTTMSRQLIGIGGHAGKQHDFIVHVGLGSADHASELVVQWPDAHDTTQRFATVDAGRYELVFDGELEPVGEDP